jgi:ribosomal protein L30/L7E
LRSLRLGERNNVTQSRQGRQEDVNIKRGTGFHAFKQKNSLRSLRLGERNMSRKAAKSEDLANAEEPINYPR